MKLYTLEGIDLSPLKTDSDVKIYKNKEDAVKRRDYLGRLWVQRLDPDEGDGELCESHYGDDLYLSYGDRILEVKIKEHDMEFTVV